MSYKKSLITVFCVAVLGFGVYKLFAASVEMEGEEVSLEKHVDISEVAEPNTPADGKGRLYVKSMDSKLYYKDDGGNEYSLCEAGGGGVDWSTRTPHMAYNKTNSGTYVQFVNETASDGYLLGVTQITHDVGNVGWLKIVVDGTTVYDDFFSHYKSYNSLQFIYRFTAAGGGLQVSHKSNNWTRTNVSWVTD